MKKVFLFFSWLVFFLFIMSTYVDNKVFKYIDGRRYIWWDSSKKVFLRSRNYVAKKIMAYTAVLLI